MKIDLEIRSLTFQCFRCNDTSYYIGSASSASRTCMDPCLSPVSRASLTVTVEWNYPRSLSAQWWYSSFNVYRSGKLCVFQTALFKIIALGWHSVCFPWSNSAKYFSSYPLGKGEVPLDFWISCFFHHLCIYMCLTVLYWFYCTVLHCILLYCTVFYCTVLYCTVGIWLSWAVTLMVVCSSGMLIMGQWYR